jgi:hypothetical protein
MVVIRFLGHQLLQPVEAAEVQMLPQNKDNQVLLAVQAADRLVLMVAVQELRAKEILVEMVVKLQILKLHQVAAEVLEQVVVLAIQVAVAMEETAQLLLYQVHLFTMRAVAVAADFKADLARVLAD